MMQLAKNAIRRAIILLGLVYAVPIYMVVTFILNLKKRATKVWINPASKQLQKLVEACPSLEGPHCSFRPTPWLFNGHLQTLWSGRDRAAPSVTYKRQILKTKDGGRAALDWALEIQGVPELVWEGPGPRPVLLLVPGLTGTSAAAYIRRAVSGALRRGWVCAVINHRGLGGVALSSSHVYSAGFTGDVRLAVQVARDTWGKDSPLLMAGFSLGGNILANYLGEEGKKAPAVAAFALGQPYDLGACDQFMRSGPVNKHFYSAGMAEHLRRAVSLHDMTHLGKVDWAATQSARTVRDFDRAFTVKMFGYRTTDHYYREASSAPRLHLVRVPFLCLNAADDPIIPASAIPHEEAEASSHVAIVVTPLGGHVAHFEGIVTPSPWWLKPMFEFLEAAVSQGSAVPRAP